MLRAMGALLALALYVAIYALPLFLLLAGYLALRGKGAAFLRTAERFMARWSRPVTTWSLYIIGSLLLLNSGWHLVSRLVPLVAVGGFAPAPALSFPVRFLSRYVPEHGATTYPPASANHP